MQLPLAEPSVIFQAVPDGAVLFSPATEIYFGLNEVGTLVWQLLPPASSSLDDLCARVGATYPDADAATIRADVSDLLADLAREGLVLPPKESGGRSDDRADG